MTERAKGGKGAPPRDPAPPDALAIAQLAARGSDGEDVRKTTPSRAAVARVRVELCRPNLEVDNDAMHYRLKMALLKGLRRRFRYSLIDIDDALAPPADSRGFTLEVEPHSAEAAQAAASVVNRVLRWRRWRKEPAGTA